MTTHRIYGLAIVALLLGALWLGRTTAQPATVPTVEPARVAVCDIAQVFNNYTRAKDLTAEMEQVARDLQVESDRRQQEVERLRAQLDALRPGSEAYQKAMDDFERAGIELQIWRRVEEAKALRSHSRLTEQMYEEILQAIDQYAQEQGYDLVLYRDNLDMPTDTQRELMSKIALRKVLYFDADLDITDAILARVNQQYSAQGQ